MKKVQIALCCALMVLGSTLILSAKDSDDMPPPWMEDVNVNGRSTYLVPKGAKREVIGSQIVVEPPNEYVARRIYEINKEFDIKFSDIAESFTLLKNEVETLEAEIMHLKDQIAELHPPSIIPVAED